MLTHEGIEPPGMVPAAYRVRSGGFTLPPGVKFEDAVMDRVRIDADVMAK